MSGLKILRTISQTLSLNRAETSMLDQGSGHTVCDALGESTLIDTQ